MFGFCMGGTQREKPKFDCQYICKKCGEILHIDDVVKHIIIDHDPNWRASFEEALDEYDRKIAWGKKR